MKILGQNQGSDIFGLDGEADVGDLAEGDWILWWAVGKGPVGGRGGKEGRIFDHGGVKAGMDATGVVVLSVLAGKEAFLDALADRGDVIGGLAEEEGFGPLPEDRIGDEVGAGEDGKVDALLVGRQGDTDGFGGGDLAGGVVIVLRGGDGGGGLPEFRFSNILVIGVHKLGDAEAVVEAEVEIGVGFFFGDIRAPLVAAPRLIFLVCHKVWHGFFLRITLDCCKFDGCPYHSVARL